MIIHDAAFIDSALSDVSQIEVPGARRALTGSSQYAILWRMQLAYLKRRKFVSLLGGAAAWPFVARTQSSIPVIGLLNGLSPIETRHVVVALDIPTCAVFVACGLLLFGAPPAVAEDVTITYKVSYGENGTPIRHKYISPGRAEAWSGPDYGFITDSTGKMTRIDHARGQYTETTEQEDAAAFQLLQRLPTFGPPLISNSVTSQKVPGRKEIADHECEHYVVTTRRQWDDARPEPRIVVNRHDYWIAPDLHLETVRARTFEVGARILQDAPGEVVKDVLSKGLVLAETWSVNDSVIASEEAIEFKTGPIDPSVFSAPPGYTKVESVSAAIIRDNANVEYSAVGTCSQTLFTAVGGDNDEDVAWDATKRAWRSCVTERLGEKWTFVRAARKQCYPREKKVAWTSAVLQGTEIVTCGQTGGDPKGKWFCHLDATPCTAPTTP